jgi:formylglycine-generating enzyme required for sulfatase activity
MRNMRVLFIGGFFVLELVLPAWTQGVTFSCPPDAVVAGTTCVDKYEASVWLTTDVALIEKIRAGTVTLAELQAGAIRKGATTDDYGPECPDTGNDCQLEFAVSLGGVTPSRFLTWFQAVAACRNAGKRLLSNVEWQAAALGTPDPGDAEGGEDCNTTAAAKQDLNVDLTGERANCVSNAGAFDLVGNVEEWVADWVPKSTGCGSWGTFSDDAQCLAGAEAPSPTTQPGALARGGNFANFLNPTEAGVFAVTGLAQPATAGDATGFRCGR